MIEKVRLSFKFGKTLYAISFALTLSAAIATVFSPSAIPTLALLKLLSVPVILYLVISLGKDDDMYFWLNLGISRKEYCFIPIVVEFLFFVILISISGVIGNAIG